jgi:hypothetical protein
LKVADQVAIHEAMEQRAISIANPRTSVLAAVNPIKDRYDPSRTLKQNVDISAPIMSRFDLFFVVLDEGDQAIDFNIARHIVSVHTGKASYNRPEFSLEDLQLYIRYARTLKPTVSEQMHTCAHASPCDRLPPRFSSSLLLLRVYSSAHFKVSSVRISLTHRYMITQRFGVHVTPWTGQREPSHRPVYRRREITSLLFPLFDFVRVLSRASSLLPVCRSDADPFARLCPLFPRPQISDAAQEELVATYTRLRRVDSNGTNKRGSRITVRQLESMIRLAEARARLDLENEVTPSHVKEAARLLKKSIVHVENRDVDLDEGEASST